MAEPAREPDPQHHADRDVRYLPVPAGRALVEAPPPRPLARAQAASPVAAAAGGFLAGVVTFLAARVLTRRQGRSAVGRALPRRRRGAGAEIAGSRSFLVDVHMLRR